MTLTVSPVVLSLALVGVLYLYVEMGLFKWRDIASHQTDEEWKTNELLIELSMTHWAGTAVAR